MGEDEDKAAILAVLEAETDAFLRRDFAALARHWVHAPQTRMMTAFAARGMQVAEGWDTIADRLRTTIESAPDAFDAAQRLQRQRVNIVVAVDMAWVSYDQVGTDTGDSFELAGVQHELKVFHRVDGAWKIGCMVVMQRSVEHAACPLIEVDAAARVLWMNPNARERLRDHAGLVVAAGHLRARRRESDLALRDAVHWTSREVSIHVAPTHATRQTRAVSLGEDDAAVPLFCWVTLDDGKVLVSFDDAQMVARRVDLATEIYGLSPAQIRLARLIVDGHDLAACAETLGVSVNTLRTHLQRIFDKTGVRSQAALVRALLSSDAPTK